MVDATAIDTIIQELALDARVGTLGVRLYLLLKSGKSLDEAATALGKSTEWLKRFERRLRNLGYIEIHEVIGANGRRQRNYKFLTRETRYLAS
jgi:predicted ArsR family transcriptional regulator